MNVQQAARTYEAARERYFDFFKNHFEHHVQPLDDARFWQLLRDAQGQLAIEKITDSCSRTMWCVVHGDAFTPKFFPSRLAAEAFQLQCGDEYVSGPWEIQLP